MPDQLIKINGSYLEGGGQILRTGCALSAITQKPCLIFNIRKNRPKPGLRPQHLWTIRALSQLCKGRIEKDHLGSEEIKFWPAEIEPKDLYIKIETAGSITLALQALILPALFSPNPIKIIFQGGATDTFFSPTFDYFQNVFLKILKKTIGFGKNSLEEDKIKINVLKRGYYPEGKAEVEVKIEPISNSLSNQSKRFKNINLNERGNLKKITVFSGASELLKDKKVAQRQIAGTKEVLGKLKLPIEEKAEYYQTQSPGSQICLVAEFEKTTIGVDNLGKLGKRAEDVGKEAALELLKEEKSKACLDKHLADQILPFLALSQGKSSTTVSEITSHCQTNIWLIEKFLNGKFKIKEKTITWLPGDQKTE